MEHEIFAVEYVIPVLIGFFSGAAGSIIAPWVYWGIEKRRDKRNARRTLINDSRRFIESQPFSGFTFTKKSQYIKLKPYLKKDVIDFVHEYKKIWNAMDDTSNLKESLKTSLLNDIQRLEKEWDLI